MHRLHFHFLAGEELEPLTTFHHFTPGWVDCWSANLTPREPLAPVGHRQLPSDVSELIAVRAHSQRARSVRHRHGM